MKKNQHVMHVGTEWAARGAVDARQAGAILTAPDAATKQELELVIHDCKKEHGA